MAVQETTTKPETSRAELLEMLLIKDKQLEAKERRIKYLETVLEQRTVKTKRSYEQNKKGFEIVKGRVLKIFLRLPPATGLSMQGIYAEYRTSHPRSNTAYLYRRVYELRESGKLWSRPDEDGSVRFFLKLEGDDHDE